MSANTAVPGGTSGLRAMYVGAVLLLVAGLAPLLDLATTDLVGDHVRAAYPRWSASTVSTEQGAIVGWLVAGSVLGLAGWWMSIRAARRGSRRLRPIAVTWLALGAVWAGMNVSVGGASYEVIVPRLFGVLTILPVVAGAAAVYRVWSRKAPTPDHG